MAEINPFGITREEVLNLAAEKLADQVAREEEVSSEVSGLIKARVESLIAKTIEARVEATLSAALESAMTTTIQPVDIYGDRVGEPTTIRDTLSARAKEFWNTKVKSDGTPTNSHDYYGNNKTRAEWMLGRIVSEKFAEEVKQNAVNILATLKENLRKDQHAAIDKHLDELIRVKSR